MKDNLVMQVKYIVIHCSDDQFKLQNAFDIHKLHLSFGWDGIGYHRVIKRNGVIEHGRPEFWIGAHVYGHNKNSLGICLIGKDKFTKNQFLSLKKLIIKLKKKYPKAEILGHSNFNNTKKTCPNFDVNSWLKKTGIA